MRTCESCNFKKFGKCSNQKSDMFNRSCDQVKTCGKWELPHACMTCKYLENNITDEPCFICNHLDKWSGRND